MKVISHKVQHEYVVETDLGGFILTVWKDEEKSKQCGKRIMAAHLKTLTGEEITSEYIVDAVHYSVIEWMDNQEFNG